MLGRSFTQNSPTYNLGNTNIVGGGGGLSSKAVCLGSLDSSYNCSQSLSGYTQPAYQTGFQQVKLVRSISDVSLLAANGFYGAAWVYCSDSTVDQQGGVYTDCQSDSNGRLIDGVQIGLIGGTSASAPAFAGMLAMISQSQGGARLGQANTVLYNLAMTIGNRRTFHCSDGGIYRNSYAHLFRHSPTNFRKSASLHRSRERHVGLWFHEYNSPDHQR